MSLHDALTNRNGPISVLQVVHEPYVKNEFVTLTKGTPDSVGYDLHAAKQVIVEPGKREVVDTGVRITVPEGTYGQIAPRSSMAMQGIDIGAGVIDRDYTGVIKVMLVNHGEYPYCVNVGAKIAQLLLIRACNDAEVVRVDSLESSVRGDGGFGSTGQ